jgi:hypothetical protein
MFKYLDPYTLRARLAPATIAAAPAFAFVALLISSLLSLERHRHDWPCRCDVCPVRFCPQPWEAD